MTTAKKTATKSAQPTMAEMIAAAVAEALAGQATKPAGKQTTAAKAEVVKPKGHKVAPDWYEGKNGKSLSIDGQDDYVMATLETGEKIRLTRKFKSIVAYKA